MPRQVFAQRRPCPTIDAIARPRTEDHHHGGVAARFLRKVKAAGETVIPVSETNAFNNDILTI